jgi:uncharacterized membrane protein
MKSTQTQDIIGKTRPQLAPADGTAARPLREGQAFGRGLPRAGLLAWLLATSLLSAFGEPAKPQYRFTEIPLPGPSYAIGIDDNGLVTGIYTDPVTGDYYSFFIEGGVLTTGIAFPGAAITVLGPANNRGVEIGNYGDDTNQQAVIYDVRRGTFTALPEIPNMTLIEGNSINDAGHAVGNAYQGGDFNNGGTGLELNWIWDGRDYDFFTLPVTNQGVYSGGINNRDQISGYYIDNVTGFPHGFLKDGPDFTTLDAPGAVYTLAFGVNNPGVVVGRYVDASGFHHGYLWTQGNFVTVDTDIPGSLGGEWYASNDHGDLAGNIWTAPGHTPHAVIGVRVDGNAFLNNGQ